MLGVVVRALASSGGDAGVNGRGVSDCGARACATAFEAARTHAKFLGKSLAMKQKII